MFHATLFTFCLYDNFASMLTIVWILGVLGVVYYSMKLWNKQLKKGSIFLMVMMCLIALAGGFTANYVITILNYPVLFALLLMFLLHNFADDEKWDLGKYMGEMIKTCFGSIALIDKPVKDMNAYIKENEKKEDNKTRYIILGIVISIPCLIILALLLGSADMVFGNMIIGLFKIFFDLSNLVPVCFMFIFGFLASYCILRYMEKNAPDISVSKTHQGEPVLAITFTGLISVLYLFFSLIQIAYLFIGNMKLPEGVTYAKYARTGFFQLLFVCVANIFLVLLVKKHFKQSKVLDVILLVISGCTAIMTVSSALRMIMYIKAYHLTFLRVWVLVSLFAIALLLAGVVVSILKNTFSFAKYTVVVLSVIYLGLSVSHVDYWIAVYNIAQMDGVDTDSVDIYYLENLSADAAPAILTYEKEYEEKYADKTLYWVRDYYVSTIQEYEDFGARKFNVSGYIAKELFEGSLVWKEYRE